MAAVIEVRGLVKKFGKLTAVNKISLKVNEGEIFGLLGPNGAGKTTTLHILATLRMPTSGTALVGGHDVSKEASAVRKTIGMVFQEPSSDDTLTGRENLYLHALMFGVERSKINAKIDEVVKLVDMEKRQNELVKFYSGGMRRRLEIARGLVHEPKVLFLDEPTLGLDPQTRENLWSYIKKLAREKGVSVIITTHYMDEAERLCDRVAIINLGKIVAMDTPENLKRVVGGGVITIRVQKPIKGTVKRLGFVKKYERVGESHVFTVSNAETNLPKLLKAVGNVKSVELREPTLNDVFLHYTGKQIKEEEEGAEGGWAERAMTYQSNQSRS